MRTIESWILGRWHAADRDHQTVHDPSTDAEVARVSSTGIDFGAVVDHARTVGGPALRAMSFAERAGLLKAAAKAIYDQREALIEQSMDEAGATRKDAKFDIDGATGTLSYYASLGASLDGEIALLDGQGEALGRSAKFWGQHVRVPKHGVALHVNAFNFPAWGFAEKMACSVLAGVPVISKPATATAHITESCVRAMVDGDLLPEGVFQLICGRTGDLVSRLGPQDVFAFTGSASTALSLRNSENLLLHNVAVNIEADSLNAAVLAPDVDDSSEAMGLFFNDVAREMTQKSGQKCTAVRRILVPTANVDDVVEELSSRLSEVVVGHPRGDGVRMGPLASRAQLDDAIRGVAELASGAKVVCGTGDRIDGVGAESGKGAYFGPALLVAEAGGPAPTLHEREVFGPVATIIPYDGTASEAAKIVSRSDGTLVVSLYSDDEKWTRSYIAEGGAFTGRLYLGSSRMAEQAMGSGLALPQSLHGGPGRAGGGEELGGLRGLELYTQCVALQGFRGSMDRMLGAQAT